VPAEEQLAASLEAGGFTLTPVVEVSASARMLGGLVYARGSKRVVAVLVRKGEQQWRIEVPRSPG